MAVTPIRQRRIVRVILAVTVVLTIIAVPFRYQQLSQICEEPRCETDPAVLSAASAAMLKSLGITLQQYAVGQIGLSLTQASIGWLLAWLLLRRRGLDRMTLIVALNSSTGGFGNPLVEWLIVALPEVAWPAAFITTISYVTFFLVFYLFPDGRFVPGWTRWPFAIFTVFELIYAVAVTLSVTQSFTLDLSWYEPFGGPIWLGSFIIIIATQLYRYYWISGEVQRRQTRWVVFGLSVSLCLAVVAVSLNLAFGPSIDPRYDLMLAFLSPWFALIIMVSLAVAVLRYRLWDIDVIIRRTLVYSVLSALLGLTYFASVVLLQTLFRNFTGQGSSQLITAASTLAIAVLFFPLRNRVQDFIDRRFYRQKYDAQKALAAFAAYARDETDVARLAVRLAGAIQETVQPEHVSVWLIKPQ